MKAPEFLAPGLWRCSDYAWEAPGIKVRIARRVAILLPARDLV